MSADRLRCVHAAEMLDEEIFAIEVFLFLLAGSCAVIGAGSFGEVEGGRSSVEVAIADIAAVGA